MTRLAVLGSKLGGWRRDRQFRNLGWFGLAEGLVKVSRLVTLVVLARLISAGELGTAALALMLFELVRSIGTGGLGQMIVRARPSELAETCAAVRRVAWMMTAVMCVLMTVLGAALAGEAESRHWPLLLACLAVVYLAWPLTLVRHFMIVRADRLPWIAGVLAVTVVADNGATAVLALLGAGVWAMILPKVLVLPIWFFGIWQAKVVMPQCAPGTRSITSGEVFRFVLPIIGSEALSALRQHADKLLIGLILGPSALGLYYLAYNAGIGLSQTLTSALATTAYPHLAEVANQPRLLLVRFDRMIRRHAAVVSGLIALQAVAIPVYVPLLLGSRWIDVPLLALLLCIGALSKPPMDVATQALRAIGATRIELLSSLLFTIISLGCLALSLPFGLVYGVLTFALMSLGCQILFALVARAVVKRMGDVQADAIVPPGAEVGQK
jgi:PST family polysaccharide transporter